MAEQFAIQCPSCQKWTVIRGHPQCFALEVNGSKFEDLVSALEVNDGVIDNHNVIKCSNTLALDCPIPFQVIIVKGYDEAARVGSQIPSWGARQVFRLRKLESRQVFWPDYYGVLFSAAPVKRQKHIFLPVLVDDRLLRNALAGVAAQTKSWVTAYVADLRVDGSDELWWRPIEAIESGRFSSNSNPFCRLCRIASRGRIDGGEAASQLLSCPCYQSDQNVISALQDNSRRGMTG
jgi:hypothetical protein